MVPFVLLTTQRSGSTVLVRTLDQHPGVFCAGELLYHGTGIHHEEARFRYWTALSAERFGRVGKAVRTLQLELRLRGFLADFYERRRAEGFKAAGFKVMFSQVQHLRRLDSLFAGPEPGSPRLLVLVREDLLAMALSLERARRSGRYHYGGEGEGRPAQVDRIEVDVDRMLADIRWFEAQNRQVLSFARGVPHHLVRYEDFAEWDRVIAGVLAFLDLQPEGALAPVLRKIGSRSPREEILNFEALAQALSGSGFRHLVDPAGHAAAG